jgi:hypothetical protein
MTAPQPADPLREALENDIRELAGATPGELAARLVERGWQRQADHATLGLRQAVIDAAIAWRADPFGIHDDPRTVGEAMTAMPATQAGRDFIGWLEDGTPFTHDPDWTLRDAIIAIEREASASAATALREALSKRSVQLHNRERHDCEWVDCPHSSCTVDRAALATPPPEKRPATRCVVPGCTVTSPRIHAHWLDGPEEQSVTTSPPSRRRSHDHHARDTGRTRPAGLGPYRSHHDSR